MTFQLLKVEGKQLIKTYTPFSFFRMSHMIPRLEDNAAAGTVCSLIPPIHKYNSKLWPLQLNT